MAKTKTRLVDGEVYNYEDTMASACPITPAKVYIVIAPLSLNPLSQLDRVYFDLKKARRRVRTLGKDAFIITMAMHDTAPIYIIGDI